MESRLAQRILFGANRLQDRLDANRCDCHHLHGEMASRFMTFQSHPAQVTMERIGGELK